MAEFWPAEEIDTESPKNGASLQLVTGESTDQTGQRPTNHVHVMFAKDVEDLLRLSPVALKPVLDREVLAAKLDSLGEYDRDSLLPLDIHITGYPLGHRFAGKTGYTRDETGAIDHRYLTLPILTLGDIGSSSEINAPDLLSPKVPKFPKGDITLEQAVAFEEALINSMKPVKPPITEENHYLAEAVEAYDPKHRKSQPSRMADYTSVHQVALHEALANNVVAPSLGFGGPIPAALEYGFDGSLWRTGAAGLVGGLALAKLLYGSYRSERDQLEQKYDSKSFQFPQAREIKKDFDYLPSLVARKNAVNRIIRLVEQT